VAQHLGDSLCATISMQPTTGLVRGVGGHRTPATRSRCRSVRASRARTSFTRWESAWTSRWYGEDFEPWSLHRSRRFEDLEPAPRCSRPGLKFVDLLDVRMCVRQDRAVRWSRGVQDGADPEMITASPEISVWHSRCRRGGGAHQRGQTTCWVELKKPTCLRTRAGIRADDEPPATLMRSRCPR